MFCPNDGRVPRKEAEAFADLFVSDDSNFDRGRFLRACRIEE